MKPLLFLIQPLDPATGARVNVRVSSVPSPVYAGMGGLTWEGAVSRRPRFMQDLMSPKLDGKILTARGDFMVNLNHVLGVSQPKSLNWSGAPVSVWDATSLDYVNLPVEFSGVVANAQLDIWTGQIILNLEVDIGRLDRPVLPGEFDGSGGLGGDVDKRGTLWPLGIGYVENAEPVWFDATNNVGMLDGYNYLTTVHALFEGGSDMGASYGDYASYALLVAAPIPPGRWATCLTVGLVRLGAPPAGRISCDCTFRGPAGTGANRAGAMIRRLLENQAGIATGSIDTVAMAALDTAVARNVHYWTKEQRSVRDLVEAIAASCNAQCLVLLNGIVSVTRAFGGATVGTLNRTGTSVPPITDWQLAQQEEPVWRMRARCGRPGVVFTFDEILYEDDLIDMGAFNIATTYRQGNLVWAPDGAQFLYINATPSSGHALPVLPATSSAYWQRTKPPPTAADLVYGDGSTIESLKPGMPGATRNIIYRQATDPAGTTTIYNGDIWADTSGDIEVQKIRTAGAWQVSATANLITWSPTAPASPANGAIWVDTSVTPNVVRVRVGAVWQIASNLVTQGTDIGVSNGAGTTVTVIPVSANVQAVGNQVRCASTAGWVSGWNTADSMGQGCFCQWTQSAASKIYMVGLTDVPITNAANNYNQIDYAAYINGTALTSYVNGSDRVLGATVALGDVLSIAYDNISIRLYKTTVAGVTTLLDTFATTAGRRFMACGTFNTVDAAGVFPVMALRFETYTNQNWSDVGGVGVPSSNAGTTVNLTSIGSSTVAIVGNSFSKSTGGSGFGGALRGDPVTGPQWVECDIVAASGYQALALDDAAADFTIGTNVLIYFYYNSGTGEWCWQTNAGTAASGTTTTGLTGKIRIEYDGLNYRFFVSGSQISTALAASASNLKLWPKWWAYNTGTVYTGLNSGAFTNNDFGAIGGPTRPSDNAGTTVNLTSIGTEPTTKIGNSFYKTGTTAHTGAVRGDPVIGAQFVAVDICPTVNIYTLVTLDDDATTYTPVTDQLFYAQYQSSSGSAVIYLGSTLIYNATIATGITGKLVASYDGTYFRMFIGGTQYGPNVAASGPSLKLWPKWLAYNPAITFTGLDAGPGPDRNWYNITGAGTPDSWSTNSDNIIPNPGLRLDTATSDLKWTFAASITREAQSAGAPAPGAAYYNGAAPAWSYAYPANANLIPWPHAKKPYLSVWVKCTAGAGNGVGTFCCACYDAATAFLGYAKLALVTTAAANTWHKLEGWADADPPAGTVGFQIFWEMPPQSYSVRTTAFSATPTQRGADITAGNAVDVLVDGATYGRLRLTELTGGNLKLTQAAGGRKLGDSKALPNVAGNNLGFIFGGAISYTSAAGTPATATISITAGTVTAGSATTAYNALSVGVSGTGGTTPRYYLYVNDPTNAGGAQTLVATTSLTTVLSGDGYVYLGYVDVFFPTSGTGGGGGQGGLGCVWDEAWVETRDRGWVQALEITAQDWLKALRQGRDGFEWVRVESVEFSTEDCYRVIAQNGFTVTISWSTPITLRDGTVTDVLHIPGHELPVDEGGLDWKVCTIEPVGRRRVVKIRCGQRTYSAGDIAGRGILTHNPKP